MENQNKITEKGISIQVNNFCKEYGHMNEVEMTLHKMIGKDAEILYPSIQTLKLSKKQEKLLLAFVNSL